jgi:hypothetical protein
VRSIGDLERTILALEGADVDSRHFAGRDLPGELRRHRSSGGSLAGEVNLTAFSILALRASGASRSAVTRSAKWLRAAQNGDGGWGFQASAASDADSTGAALQGLAAAGGNRQAMRRGVAWLRRAQEADGGFALGGGGPSNSQSTAWAIQGLVAAGANPARVREHGRSPLVYLSKRQRGDGHYAYSAASDQTPVWVTGQALVAAKRRAFPLRPVPRPARHDSSSRHHHGGSAEAAPSSPPAAGSSPVPATPTPSGGESGGQSGGATVTAKPPRANSSAGTTRQARGPTSVRASAAPRSTAVPVSSPADPAAGTAASEGRSHTVAFVLGGLGALALVLAGGFVWYRRRLP